MASELALCFFSIFHWSLPHQHLGFFLSLSKPLQLWLYLQLKLICFCVCLPVCVCVPSSHLGHLAGLYKYHTSGRSLTGFSQLTGAKEQGCWCTHTYMTSLMVNTVVRCVRKYTHSNQREWASHAGPLSEWRPSHQGRGSLKWAGFPVWETVPMAMLQMELT